jgi:PAS domain S-box-containing protein
MNTLDKGSRRRRYSSKERRERKIKESRGAAQKLLLLQWIAFLLLTLYAVGVLLLNVSLPRTFHAALLLLVALIGSVLWVRAWQNVKHYAHTVEENLKKELTVVEGRYRALVENSIDIVTIIDPTTRILFQSPAVTRILGYDIEEFASRPLLEYVYPDDKALIQKALEKRSTFYFTLRIQHEDGRWLWFEALGSNKMEDPNIRGIILSLRDITDRKKEEELTRQKEIAAVKMALEKEQVEREKRIIEEGKRKLEEAYRIIEEKNEEILDSITYASRIQQAVVPDIRPLKQVFPESFLLWLPRDIVSGDFYWYHHFGRYTCVTAADCTGHGVPGAFMTMIGTILLNQIVLQEGTVMPDQVLNKLHVYIRKALKQDQGGEQKDGMDISFTTFDHEKKVVYWAGANNPLIIARNGEEEPIEIKPDKKAIGGRQDEAERIFTLHQVEVQPGDMLYMYSDGYQDQFGGPKRKKFMVGKFKKLLQHVCSLPADQQQKELLRVFEEWKGDQYEQVDDVLVLGIRVTW